ncbi:MAG: helix-turn-helix transcriptional regulator [Halobacteriaceae archaeon]
MSEEGLNAGSSTALDALEYVARSETRVALLETLDAAAPLTERTLRERVDASRTTVHRTVDDFEARGWITTESGTIALTALGQGIADAILAALEELTVVTDLTPFLKHVPADALDIEPAALEGATLTTAVDGEPYAPVDRVTSLRESAETVMEVSSIVARESAEQVRRRADAGEATYEIILTTTVCERIQRSSDLREATAATLEADGVSMYVTEEPVPIPIVIADDVVALGATDESGVPVCLLETTAAAVREWAYETFETLRQDATPLELD